MKLNTEMSTILQYPATHNHEDDEEEITAEKIRQKLKKQVKNDPTKLLQNVYNEEVERTTNSIFPEYRNVKSSFYETRSRQLPPIPRSFRTLHIRGPWKKTLNGGKFLLENDRENGIVIFSTNEDLKILASCENILGDGTFKSCPPAFEQLHILFVNSDRTVPLVFGLLSGKSTFIYRKFFRHIFRKIQNLGPENEIENIITDYERGVISAIETDYPKIKHYACFFHYSKAIYRKIQDFG